MKKTFINIILATSIVLTNLSWAKDAQYYIIVDAGSTGSRLHLFQHDSDSTMPIINDIFTKKNSVPLASFTDNLANEAGKSLEPLLQDVVKKLQAEPHITSTVPISVLGTAGMRMLSTDQQNAIYSAVKKHIDDNYKNLLNTAEIQTIPGKMEALYDWLDVNYLANNFQTQTATVGSLDMGGISTQIAFATDKTNKPIDYVALKINDKNYTVFTKSFLGLGLDQARASMNIDQDAHSCYPTDAPHNLMSEGNFNLVTCASIYRSLIESYQVAEQIAPVYKVPAFVAFSGTYYTYHFFEVDQNPPDQETLEQQVLNPVCSNSWETLKQAYPAEPEQFLSSYCANAIFITHLFYGAYQVQNTQLKVLSKINEQNIDWTLGAMLYHLIKK